MITDGIFINNRSKLWHHSIYIYTHTHILFPAHGITWYWPVHRYYAVRLLRAFVLDYSLDRYNFDSPSSLSILPQPGNTVIRLFATDWRFSNWGSNRWRVNRKRQFPRHRISCIVNGRGSHDERGRSVVEFVGFESIVETYEESR